MTTTQNPSILAEYLGRPAPIQGCAECGTDEKQTVMLQQHPDGTARWDSFCCSCYQHTDLGSADLADRLARRALAQPQPALPDEVLVSIVAEIQRLRQRGFTDIHIRNPETGEELRLLIAPMSAWNGPLVTLQRRLEVVPASGSREPVVKLPRFASMTEPQPAPDALREALEWYADVTRYQERSDNRGYMPILDDRGEKARAALAQAEAE